MAAGSSTLPAQAEQDPHPRVHFSREMGADPAGLTEYPNDTLDAIRAR